MKSSIIFCVGSLFLFSSLLAQQQEIGSSPVSQRPQRTWDQQGQLQYKDQIRQNKIALQQQQLGRSQAKNVQDSQVQKSQRSWDKQGQSQYGDQIKQNQRTLQQHQQARLQTKKLDGVAVQQPQQSWDKQGQTHYTDQIKQNKMALQQQMWSQQRRQALP